MSIEGLLKAFELEKKILGIGEKKCPVEAIVEAETFLGVTFPPTYRYFLEYITLNTLTPISNLAILPDNSLDLQWSGVIVNTQRNRNWEQDPLPDQFIVVDIDGPDFLHILDTTQVDQIGESKVICWLGDVYFDSDYSDFDGLYLQLVNGAIYSMMSDKADERKLLRQEVEDYIAFYKSLGFTGKEYRFLEENWHTLFDIAS